MDSQKEQHRSNIKRVTHPHFLRRAVQVVLSMSILSFLFYNPSLPPLFLQSYQHLISNLPIKLSERNCIFLVCNGILVLILGTSGPPAGKITPVKRAGTEEVHGMDEEKGSDFVEKGKIERREVSKEAGEEDENEEEELSRDELNKKFEDFITRMKREIQEKMKMDGQVSFS